MVKWREEGITAEGTVVCVGRRRMGSGMEMMKNLIRPETQKIAFNSV